VKNVAATVRKRKKRDCGEEKKAREKKRFARHFSLSFFLRSRIRATEEI
jgi:hypothetical protein